MKALTVLFAATVVLFVAGREAARGRPSVNDGPAPGTGREVRRRAPTRINMKVSFRLGCVKVKLESGIRIIDAEMGVHRAHTAHRWSPCPLRPYSRTSVRCCGPDPTWGASRSGDGGECYSPAAIVGRVTLIEVPFPPESISRWPFRCRTLSPIPAMPTPIMALPRRADSRISDWIP